MLNLDALRPAEYRGYPRLPVRADAPPMRSLRAIGPVPISPGARAPGTGRLTARTGIRIRVDQARTGGRPYHKVYSTQGPARGSGNVARTSRLGSFSLFTHQAQTHRYHQIPIPTQAREAPMFRLIRRAIGGIFVVMIIIYLVSMALMKLFPADKDN